MKQTLTFILAAFAILIFDGCAHAPVNATPEQIAAVNAQNQQTLSDSATVLKGAARAVAVAAIQKDPSNAQHVRQGVLVLETFLTGTDYTPGALTTAFQPVFKEIKDPMVGLAINSALDLYQIFYGRLAKGQINQNEIAHALLTALHDGGTEALPQ